jgi:hypothetical protein
VDRRGGSRLQYPEVDQVRGYQARPLPWCPGRGDRREQSMAQGGASWESRPLLGDAASGHGRGGVGEVEHSVLAVPLSSDRLVRLPVDAGLISTVRAREVSFGRIIGTKGGIARPSSGGLGLAGFVFLWRWISKAFTDLSGQPKFVHQVLACPKGICSAKASLSGNVGAYQVQAWEKIYSIA